MHALRSPLSFSAGPSALPQLKESMMIRRLMTILAAATLVLGVLTAAAEANGSRRLGSQIRFGSLPGPYGSGLLSISGTEMELTVVISLTSGRSSRLGHRSATEPSGRCPNPWYKRVLFWTALAGLTWLTSDLDR
jgi:hypothetical protein